MPKSIKFVTACYIMSFVAAKGPKRLSTGTIAKWVAVHPGRVRQLVAKLVKAKLLESQEGGGGGVCLARPPKKITLREVLDAVEDTSLVGFHVDNPFSEWDDQCYVFPLLTQFKDAAEQDLRQRLAKMTIDQFYPANDVGGGTATKRKRG